MSQINTSGLGNAQLSSQVSVAVAKKTLDIAKTQGQEVLSLLEGAAALQQQTAVRSDPHRGQLLDTFG